MTRFLVYLALFALALFGTALGWGLTLGDLQSVARERDQVRTELALLESRTSADAEQLQSLRTRRSELSEELAAVEYHMLFGVAATLGVILAHSIVVTYFIGTTRWCREVVETYKLDISFVQRSAALKRQAFPWAVAAMLTVLVVSVLGAAAHPGLRLGGGPTWVYAHWLAALAAVAMILAAFYVEWSCVAAHHRLIAAVMQEVGRVRRERRLED